MRETFDKPRVDQDLHDPERLLTVAECASCARLSVATVRRRIRDGSIPAIQHGKGQAIRIRYEDCIGRTAQSGAAHGVRQSAKSAEHITTTEKENTISGPRPRWLRPSREVVRGKDTRNLNAEIKPEYTRAV